MQMNLQVWAGRAESERNHCSSSHRVAFLLSTQPGPTCTGIQSDDVCCPNSCGECGGTTVEPRYRRVYISRTAYQRTLYVLEERTYVCTSAMHVDASLHTPKSSCNPESTRPRHPPCTYECCAQVANAAAETAEKPAAHHL